MNATWSLCQHTRLTALSDSNYTFPAPRTASRLCEYIRLRVFYSLYGFSLVTYYGMTCNYVRRDMKPVNEGEINPVWMIHHGNQLQSLIQMPEIIYKFHHGSYYLVLFYIFKLQTHRSIPQSDKNSPVIQNSLSSIASKYCFAQI